MVSSEKIVTVRHSKGKTVTAIINSAVIIAIVILVSVAVNAAAESNARSYGHYRY